MYSRTIHFIATLVLTLHRQELSQQRGDANQVILPEEGLQWVRKKWPETRSTTRTKVVLLLSVLTMCGCDSYYRVAPFDESDMIWFAPFNVANDTAIFVSQSGELDTIIFHKQESASDSTRSIGQGFSNTNYLTVRYDITRGSYHKFTVVHEGTDTCTQNFASMAKSSSGHESLEIVFIGMLFNGENLDRIRKRNDSTFFFDGADANYNGICVDEGINDFTFNTNRGVIEYTDRRNIKWTRNNVSRTQQTRN